MLHVALRRIPRAIGVILGVLTVVFGLLQLSGDPARLMLPEGAGEQEILEVRQRLGLDQPLAVQWWRFVVRAAAGDFGFSYYQGRPAIEVVAEHLPATLQLAVSSLTLALGIGVPLGIWAAVRRRSWVDRLITSTVLVGRSMPTFWVGIMLILFLGVTLRWLPVSGYGTPAHLVLPSLTLAVYLAPPLSRLVRSSMLEVLRAEYIRSARAKGLPEARVLLLHALKNASIPVTTMAGLQLGALLGGAVITETVFAWPGVGRLLVVSVQKLDYPVVQAVTALTATAIVAINVMTDLLYARLDPRVRIR